MGIFDGVSREINKQLRECLHMEKKRELRGIYYILVNGEVVPATMQESGAQLAQGKERIIGQTQVGSKFVSTVFLTIDHSHGRGSVPILFETMVFDNDKGDECGQWRYATLEEAQVGHQIVVTSLEAGIEPAMDRDDPRWTKAFFEMYTGLE